MALTIAGSDSGGGAGIQADLKTFAAVGAHGTSVITAVTAQNPRRIIAVQPCKPALVLQQLRAVFEEMPPRAMKTGMLYSSSIILAVAAFLRSRRTLAPLIIDPVSIATSGRRLLKRDAVMELKKALLPLAALVTPNLPEAESWTGFRIEEPEDMRRAARVLFRDFGCAVLIKGGHLRNTKEAVDVFYDGRNELLLTAPYIKGLKLHGAGCTYSAAITGFMARGYELPKAVELGKTYITQAIAQAGWVGSHPVLGAC